MATAAFGWTGEFLRYFTASAVALAVDLLVYSACLRAGAGWPIAAAAGFCSGLAVAYGLSIRVVFRYRNIPNRRVEFTAFAAIGLLGLLATELVLWLLIEGWRVDAHHAKLVAAGATFLLNFSLRKALLFRSAPSRPRG